MQWLPSLLSTTGMKRKEQKKRIRNHAGLWLKTLYFATNDKMDTDREDSVIFNTHAYVKKLIASGMPEAQAEAQMEIFIQFIDNRLATKLSLTNPIFGSIFS